MYKRQVLLDNVTFDGNYNGTKTVGSALYLEGTNATVINSKFINLKDISAIHEMCIRDRSNR